ncbi:MAG: family 20 glycosylhydrolase [Opitutales bacterium]|nr:family 20 glycosylhydrolase [Opitutales bacterium]
MNTKNIVISTVLALSAVLTPALAKPAEKVPSYAAEPVAALAQAIEDFSVEKNLDLSGSKVVYKNLPAGVKASIVATTYEQLIAADGTIRHPISPKSTQVTFKLSKGSESSLTKTFTIAVPVSSKKTNGKANEKPAVVPAIQEWLGAEGVFKPGKKLTIVLRERDAKTGKPTLRERAELFAEELKAELDASVELKVVKDERPTGGIVILLNPKGDVSFLGKEGYCMQVRPNGVQIESSDPTGAFWATRTILQVFRQQKNTFPCGEVVDYPQYGLRGFSYDVGRKPASMDALINSMKTMSYYKMNDLQIHLNDNYIWMHEYTDIPNDKNASPEQKQAAIKEVLAAAPTAFRLESKVKGKDGTPLTAQDCFYTKEEFGKFIDLANLYGVNIVPEIDVPAHAMSLVKVRPDLMYRGAVSKAHDVERTAMLDASNDIYKGKKTYRQETLDFVKSIFDEYILPQKGKEPVFRDCKVHIGTDEYYGNSEDYRAFAAELLNYIKSRGRTPRLWGSFSAKRGNTPVDGTGCEIDMWNIGYQDPRAAIDEYNFDLININDGDCYIVPLAGYYYDKLNLQRLYSNAWQPHVMGKRSVLPGHPKLLGAQWAIWNDMSFRKDVGLCDYELFVERIAPACAVYAEKTWNNAEDRDLKSFLDVTKAVGFSPGNNPTYTFPADKKGVFYKKAGKVVLKGGDSAEETGIVGLAPDYIVEFTVRRDKGGNGEQVLFSGPTGQVMAVQKDTGKFGIVRDAWLYSFDYTLPENKAVKIKLVAKEKKLTLFVDDKEIGAPKRHLYNDQVRSNAFVFPLQNIGAHKNAFKGTIENLIIRTHE